MTKVSQEAREAEVTQADRAAAQAILDTWFNRSVIETILARHRQSAERGEDWRPIETAPKDGTWFLAYWPVQTFEDRIQTTRWLHGDCRFVDASDFMDHIQPTHWQPLPTPPEAVRTPIEGTSHAD